MDLSTYTTLITSEHRNRPKFMAMVSALVQPMIDVQNLLEDYSSYFDLDLAVGDQLNILGEWIGESRDLNVPITDVWFSLGVVGLGFGEATWFNPTTDNLYELVTLPDDTYRTLLRAKIAANIWDGTIPGAYRVWAIVFELEGFQILLQDNQDMTMTVFVLASALDAVRSALLENGKIVMKPAGVGITGYVTVQVPMFGFGIENNLIAGFGSGIWTSL